MRTLIGIVGFLLVVAVLGLLVTKQLFPVKPVSQHATLPRQATEPGAASRQQGEQIQQQVRETLENTLQQARPMPDVK